MKDQITLKDKLSLILILFLFIFLQVMTLHISIYLKLIFLGIMFFATVSVLMIYNVFKKQ